MQNRPKLIGITGGIGSGKSIVCKIFQSLGHKIYYADDRAKWLMEHDQRLTLFISNLFGSLAYENGHLNRKFIAEKVFVDKELLIQLNEVVHPAVANDLENWIKQHQDERILLDEAALMFETGSYKKMDATILVVATEELRIRRIMKRDPHRSMESIKGIISNQMRDQEKIPMADYVIDNNGKKSVINQVMEIYDKVI